MPALRIHPISESQRAIAIVAMLAEEVGWVFATANLRSSVRFVIPNESPFVKLKSLTQR
jgi:hypothetical protein